MDKLSEITPIVKRKQKLSQIAALKLTPRCAGYPSFTNIRTDT